MGVVWVTLPFFKFCPNHIIGIGEATHFKFRVLIDRSNMHDILPREGTCDVSSDLLKFWETSDIISWTVQERDIVACGNRNNNSKSYVAYRLAPLPMPLTDLEGHFCCLKTLTPIPRETARIY